MMTSLKTSANARPAVVRRAAAVLALLAPLAGAACSDEGPADPIKLGSFAVTIAGDSATARAVPNALFFLTGDIRLPDSRTDSNDGCETRVYSSTAEGEASAPALDAGEALLFDAGEAEALLVPVRGPAGTRYVLNADVDGPVVTPGQVVSFRVPGAANGYPADTVSIRTAEAFTFQPVTVPAAGQALTLTWSGAAADAGTGMIVSLRTSSLASRVLDRQLLCFLRDDGTQTLPALLLSDWRTATSRQVLAVRWRTDSRTAGPNAVSYAVATYAKTVPVNEPAR